MKAFIEANFKMIDIDSDGVIGTKEYRFNCITRVAVDNIQTVDDAFDKLLDVSTICICVFLCSFLFLFNPWQFFFCLRLFVRSCFIVVLQFVWCISIFWLSLRMQKKKNKLQLQDEDRRRGGLTLARYQELYGHYLGNTDETHPGVHLFGPLSL